MRIVFVPALLLLSSLPFGSPAPPAPVVVELFTSEGCSSCPPADRLLAQLATEPNVIALGFHVDYWDNGGWRDRFSSHRYTERQEAYGVRFRLGSVYTPQLVAGGQAEAVGNDEAAVRSAIEHARSHPQPAHVALAAVGNDALSVKVELQPVGFTEPAEILLAITEDGLTTEVKGGENNSRTLRHWAVVRRAQVLGGVKGGNKFEQAVALKLDPAWRRDHLHAVVLVQQPAGGAILGATSLALN